MALPTAPQLQWIDPVYQAFVAGHDKSLQTALGGLNQQRNATSADYGYTPTYDVNGYVQSVQVDPNNPYSKANLMSQSYKDNMARNKNSFAGRGQLYAGSLNSAQNQAGRNFNIGSNNLQNAFINFIAQNQGAQNEAVNTYNTDVTGAYGEAVGRHVDTDTGENTPKTTTAPAPPNSNASGQTGVFNPRAMTYLDTAGRMHEVKRGSGDKAGWFYYKTSSGDWALLPGGSAYK